MTAFPEISQRVRYKYHNLEDDEMVKRIFNSKKNKARVGMKIPSWMITDESTQGMHKATSTPRIPNPGMDEGESSVPRKSNVIRLCIPLRRSTRLTSPTPVPTIAEVKDMTLQNTIQLSIAEQKSRDDFKARQNVEKVNEHLVAEEIEKMVRARSYKESLEVEKIADVSQPVNVIEEDEVEDDYELRRRLIMERQQSQANVGNMIIDAIQQERENLRAEISLQINNAITNHIPSQASNTPCRTFAIHPRDQDDPHNDAHLERENSAKRKEILSLPFPQKPTLVIQSFQTDPKAPALSLINQDLSYLKKGNSGPEKILLSLHKFPTVIFPNEEIKERTSRLVAECVKKFNLYA
nr:hypothetical protein [Tanacetum cinerariifolium]